MEENRLFICHLEAEYGTYPEYCVQDVCCGIYKQPNHLISVIGAFLISLLIIAQTCGLIYAWFTFREEHTFSSQDSYREAQGQKQKLRNPGKEKERKINTALVNRSEKHENDEEDEDGGRYENGKSKTSYEGSRDETIGKYSKKSKKIEVSENKPTIESAMISETSESISTRPQKKNNTDNEGKETPSTEINHEPREDHNRSDLTRSKKISNKTAQEKKSSLTKSEQEGSNDEYDDDDDDDDDERVNKHTSEDIDSTIASETGKSSSSRIGNMNSTHNNKTPTKNNNDPGKEVKSGSTAYKIINTPTDGKPPSSTKPKQEEKHVDDDDYGDDDYDNSKDTLKKYRKGS